MRLRSQAVPPYVVVEVEKAPGSGRLSQLCAMFEVLSIAIERLANYEVEIHGGCWVELAKRPPCYENQAEYGGKCYLPVSARSRDKKREPQSLQP